MKITEKLKKATLWITKWSVPILALVVLVGVFVVFVMGIKYPESVTLTMLNNFVGIILGVTATMMSIVSLLLSFYNVEQAEESAKESIKNNNEISASIKQVNENTDMMAKMLPEIKEKVTSIDNKTSLSTTSQHEQKDITSWDNDPWLG